MRAGIEAENRGARGSRPRRATSDRGLRWSLGPAVVALVLVLAGPGFAAIGVLVGHAATPGSTAAGKELQQHAAGKSATMNHVRAAHQAYARSSVTSGTSNYWAGYVTVPSTSGQIDEVFAEWFVPTITCASTLTGASDQATWIGIDGYGSSSTVEQTGTDAYCSGASATPAYSLWWEFYPYNKPQYGSSVSPGDLIQAYVLYNPTACVNSVCGVFSLSITDLNSYAWMAQTANPSSCQTSPITGSTACMTGTDSTAECISEAPPGVLLSKYSTQSFYNCMASIGGHFKGIGQFAPLYKITTTGISSGVTIQSLSGLSNGYSSTYWAKSVFTVTWKGYN